MDFGGSWTEEKLEILGKYLNAYTTALKNQRFRLIYVDAFAGTGSWRSGVGYSPDDYDDFQEVHEGSARLALQVDDKPFDRLVFIEKDTARFWSLDKIRRENEHRCIELRNWDANDELPRFCRSMGKCDRAVVFLDPFATQVKWSTVEAIAKTKKIDCWILFPLMAITRMMPKENEPSEACSVRLDTVFGGREHWRDHLYQPSQQPPLFGGEELERPKGSDQIALLYQQRLKEVFTGVADMRRTLRNSKNSPMFELFFVAGNPKGASIAIDIADHILRRW